MKKKPAINGNRLISIYEENKIDKIYIKKI